VNLYSGILPGSNTVEEDAAEAKKTEESADTTGAADSNSEKETADRGLTHTQ
jgi:hypothetical protein